MPGQSRLLTQALKSVIVLFAAFPFAAAGTDTQILQSRIRELEQQLAAARAELEQATAKEQVLQTESDVLREDVAANDLFTRKTGNSERSSGTLKIGGATRVNYAIGDYGSSTGGPSRAEGDGGNFSLDTFSFNFDFGLSPVFKHPTGCNLINRTGMCVAPAPVQDFSSAFLDGCPVTVLEWSTRHVIFMPPVIKQGSLIHHRAHHLDSRVRRQII